MNSHTSAALDTGYGHADDRSSGSGHTHMPGEFILLSEVEDLIRDTTWLSGEELAEEQPVFCLRRAAARQARDELGRAFARHALNNANARS